MGRYLKGIIISQSQAYIHTETIALKFGPHPSHPMKCRSHMERKQSRNVNRDSVPLRSLDNGVGVSMA